MLFSLLDQLLTAIDLLGSTAGLSVDLLRWVVLALTAAGVVALVRVQRTR